MADIAGYVVWSLDWHSSASSVWQETRYSSLPPTSTRLTFRAFFALLTLSTVKNPSAPNYHGQHYFRVNIKSHMTFAISFKVSSELGKAQAQKDDHQGLRKKLELLGMELVLLSVSPDGTKEQWGLDARPEELRRFARKIRFVPTHAKLYAFDSNQQVLRSNRAHGSAMTQTGAKRDSNVDDEVPLISDDWDHEDESLNVTNIEYNELPTYDYSQSEKQYLILTTLRANGIDPLSMGDMGVVDFFPLHERSLQRSLLKQWVLRPWKFQPLDQIREYFGEQIAFYFAFLGHLVTWLLPLTLICLSIFGIAQLVHIWIPKTGGWFTTILVNVTPFWMFLMIVFWRRKSASLAVRWGVEDLEFTEETRSEYRGVPRRGEWVGDEFVAFSSNSNAAPTIPTLNHDSIPPRTFSHGFTQYWYSQGEEPETRRSSSHNMRDMSLGSSTSINSLAKDFQPILSDKHKTALPDRCSIYEDPQVRRKRICLVSIPVVLLTLVVALGVAIAIIFLNYYVTSHGKSTALYGSMGVGGLNGFLISAETFLYRRLASGLTTFENHRTQSSYDNSLILKIFVFDFVNAYAALFWQGFVKYNVDLGLEWTKHGGGCSLLSGDERFDCVQKETGTFVIFSMAAQMAFFQLFEFIIPLINAKVKLCRTRRDMRKRAHRTNVASMSQDDLMASWRGSSKNGGEGSKAMLDPPDSEFEDNGGSSNENGIGEYVSEKDEENGIAFGAKDPDRLTRRARIESQMFSPHNIIIEYAPLMTQLGMLILFASATPFAPALAFISLWLELRFDSYKFLSLNRRAFASRVSGIGMQNNILNLLAICAVFTNALGLAFYAQPTVKRLMTIFVSYNLLLICAWLSTFVTDTPKASRQIKAKRRLLKQELFAKHLDESEFSNVAYPTSHPESTPSEHPTRGDVGSFYQAQDMDNCEPFGAVAPTSRSDAFAYTSDSNSEMSYAGGDD